MAKRDPYASMNQGQLIEAAQEGDRRAQAALAKRGIGVTPADVDVVNKGLLTAPLAALAGPLMPEELAGQQLLQAASRTVLPAVAGISRALTSPQASRGQANFGGDDAQAAARKIARDIVYKAAARTGALNGIFFDGNPTRLSSFWTDIHMRSVESLEDLKNLLKTFTEENPKPYGASITQEQVQKAIDRLEPQVQHSTDLLNGKYKFVGPASGNNNYSYIDPKTNRLLDFPNVDVSKIPSAKLKEYYADMVKRGYGVGEFGKYLYDLNKGRFTQGSRGSYRDEAGIMQPKPAKEYKINLNALPPVAGALGAGALAEDQQQNK
jgi:hypothetical protein